MPLIPYAWLVVAPQQRHLSVHLDLARAMQQAVEVHGTVKALVLEEQVAEMLASLRQQTAQQQRALDEAIAADYARLQALEEAANRREQP